MARQRPQQHRDGTAGGASLRRRLALVLGLLTALAAPTALAVQERLPLDSIAADGCNWTGCSVANLDEDPDGPGTDWATAASENDDHVGHFGFGTPTGPLLVGADLQEFRASLRKNSTCGTGTPTARIELWESGALVRAGTNVAITAANSCTQGTNCQLLSFTWNASEVASAANVEVKVFGDHAAGSPATRCAVDLGAVEWNAEVSAGGPSLPTLSSPTASAIDTATATLGATIETNGGAAVTEYGTVWGTAPAPTGAAAAAGATPGPLPFSFSHGRGFAEPPGSQIYYRGYAVNTAGTGYSPDGTFFTEPNQASGLSFSAVGDNTITVSWTPGGGDGTIVVMRQGAPVSQTPADGTAYNASSVFGSGDEVGPGTGNRVVFRGAGSSVAVTGLAPGTTYHVAVYEYAGSGTLINYQQDGPLLDSQATTGTGGGEPTAGPSQVRFASALDGTLDVSWLPGNGDGVIVVMRLGVAVNSDPVDGTEYTASTVFGAGDPVGTDNFVVFKGAASQVTVTNLAADLTYHVSVYEYAGSGAAIDYLQSAPATGSSGHNAAHGIDCVSCHFGTGDFHGSFQVAVGTDQESKCRSCHNPSGLASAKSDVFLHTGTKYSTIVDCGSCHEVHNNYDFTTTDTHTGGATSNNVEWIRSDTTKWVPAALEPALFQANTGFFAYDDASAPWNGVCQTCHTKTDRHRNNNTPANPHSHEVLNNCTGCHTHDGPQGNGNGFSPSGGDCTGCHSSQQEISSNPGNFRRQITESGAGVGDGEFGTSFNSHHVNDGTGSQIVTKWDCVVCHAEGDVLTGSTVSGVHQNGLVELKDTDTETALSGDWRTLTAVERTDFCLSCHDVDGATIVSTRTDPDPDATADPLNPFDDGVTNAHEPAGLDGTPAPHSRLQVIDVASQFDTANTSHHAVLGAAYGAAAPFGSPVDNAIQGVRTDLAWNSTLDCEDCHYGTPDTMLSGHGTLNARYMLRDASGNDTLASAANTICFRCHNPSDSVSVYPEHDKGNHLDDTRNLYGIACLNCHGGRPFGGIHGVDQPVTDDDGGGTYNPNVFTYGGGLDLISNWTNWDRNAVTCSARSSANVDFLSDCDQHGAMNWDRIGASPTRSYRNP